MATRDSRGFVGVLFCLQNSLTSETVRTIGFCALFALYDDMYIDAV